MTSKTIKPGEAGYAHFAGSFTVKAEGGEHATDGVEGAYALIAIDLQGVKATPLGFGGALAAAAKQYLSHFPEGLPRDSATQALVENFLVSLFQEGVQRVNKN